MIALNSWLKSALAATTVAGVLAACTVTTGPDTDTPDLDIDSGTRVDSGTTTDSGTTDAGSIDAGGETCDFPSFGVDACDTCVQANCVDAVCGCFSSNLEAGDYSCASYDEDSAACVLGAEGLPEEEQADFINDCLDGLDEEYASNGGAGSVVAYDAFLACAENSCAASCLPE